MMRKIEKGSSSPYSSSCFTRRSTSIMQDEKRAIESIEEGNDIETREAITNSIIQVDSMTNRKQDEWKMIGGQRSNKIERINMNASAAPTTVFEQPIQQGTRVEGVHFY